MKILLRDHTAVHAETKFIATGRREEEGGDVDTEVGNLQTISNDDVGERCAADQLVCIDEHQIDFDAIRAFGVGHAEVQAELMVLKRERHRLEVGEQADQRFFLVRLSSMTQSQTRNACTLGGETSVMRSGHCQPSTAVPPRASKTSPNSVWVDPMRQKCDVISMSWPRCE